MRLLLDTQALLWWLRDDPRLGPRSRGLIADRSNDVLASVVSLWEITVKFRVGKLAERGSAIWPEVADEGFGMLGVTEAHLAELDDLPRHHGDPFDHLILAQAKAEGATVITSDRHMTRYGVACIDTR